MAVRHWGPSRHLFLRVAMSLCKWLFTGILLFSPADSSRIFSEKIIFLFLKVKKWFGRWEDFSRFSSVFYCWLFFSTSSRRLLQWLLGGRFIRWLFPIAFSPHPAAPFCGRLVWIFNVLFTWFFCFCVFLPKFGAKFKVVIFGWIWIFILNFQIWFRNLIWFWMFSRFILIFNLV